MHSRLRASILTLSFVAATAAAAAVLSSCSQFHPAEDAAAPNTGSPETETQTGTVNAADIQAGDHLYITSDRLRLRSTPEIGNDNVAGVLEVNDEVQVVNPIPVGEQNMVAVKVVKTGTETSTEKSMFVPAAYVSKTPVALSPERSAAGQLTVIVNVATNRARVYRKCAASENCTNKLIFEDQTVNGEDVDGRRTNIGSYKVESWTKFYGVPGKYVPWYTAGEPIPKKSQGWDPWKGPFGWYTAKVGPNGDGEWFHGVGGWGSDHYEYINFRNTLIGHIAHIFMAIDSHGCTRLTNEAISLMRSTVPLGTRYLKVYAKEALRDPSRSGYTRDDHTFDYILTTKGAQSTKNQPDDRATVLADGTPQSQWIEEGTAVYHAYPTPIKFTGSHSDKGGNLYGIPADAFRGVYYVDDGTFVGYEAPRDAKLDYGGYMENGRPAALPSANVLKSAPAGASDPTQKITDNRQPKTTASAKRAPAHDDSDENTGDDSAE